jgi:hypothetical protein
LGRVVRGNDEGVTSGARRERHRQRAAHRTQFAGERELAGELLACECFGCDLPARRKDSERDRQVEAARVLGQLGRREIDGDAPRGKLEVRVIERARTRSRARALPYPAVRRCGKPAARPEVHFHRHLERVDAGERAARHGRDRHRR